MIERRLRVVARIAARQDTIDEVQAILIGLIRPTRAERGCLRYELLQNHADSTDFTFVEEWLDEDTLEAHFLTPHVRDALVKVGSLLAAPPDIRRYRLLV